MQFTFLDDILSLEGNRISARKRVDPKEPYLADHFPGFPILPGVLMLETMVQAARHLCESQGSDPVVVGQVRAVKYGAMVKPGHALRVEVNIEEGEDSGTYLCRGTGFVEGGPNDGDTAISGRFTMRPVQVLNAAHAAKQEPETTCS